MIRFLEKLNLKPNEIRVVVGMGFVLFAVLNVMFVWPRFGDVGRSQARIEQLQKDLVRFKKEIANAPGLEARLRNLEKEGGAVLAEDQALALIRTVQSLANTAGVVPQGVTPVNRTGAASNPTDFFEEQSVTMGLEAAQEEKLVDFLYNLGSGTSLIRVRAMTLRPDPSNQKLNGSLTLTASYQKKPPAKKAPAPAPAAPDASAKKSAATNAPAKKS